MGCVVVDYFIKFSFLLVLMDTISSRPTEAWCRGGAARPGLLSLSVSRTRPLGGAAVRVCSPFLFSPVVCRGVFKGSGLLSVWFLAPPALHTGLPGKAEPLVCGRPPIPLLMQLGTLI